MLFFRNNLRLNKIAFYSLVAVCHALPLSGSSASNVAYADTLTASPQGSSDFDNNNSNGSGNIKGEFHDPDSGLTITFPDGWSGIQSRTENGTVVFMMPMENTSTQDDKTSITLGISKTETLSDEGRSLGIGVPPIVGLLSGAKCNPVTDYPKINGMSAAVMDWECKSNDQVSFKQKTIGFQTDKYTIVFLYMSSTPAYYDKHLTEFSKSVDTSLKIPNTIGPPSTPEFSSGTTLGVTTAATIGFIMFILPRRSGLIKRGGKLIAESLRRFF